MEILCTRLYTELAYTCTQHTSSTLHRNTYNNNNVCVCGKEGVKYILATCIKIYMYV